MSEADAVSDPDEIQSLEDIESRYLSRTLARYAGDRKSLAVKLGISERALYRKISSLRKAKS